MKTALVLACDDNFVAYASVVARRAARLSSEKFPIVIVSDGVTEENKRLAQKFCPQISFIEASHLFAEREFYTRKTFTRAVYMRLFLDEILADFDYAVYIDSDMSVLADLSSLVAMRPKAAPIIASYDLVQLYDQLIYKRLPLSEDAGYLQGGLLVFDLKAVRAERIFADALKLCLENTGAWEMLEQDALNVLLQGRWQVLDWRWNVVHFCVSSFPKPYFIRHMTGYKPWSPNKTTAEPYLVKQWRDDLAESPWPHKFHAEVRQPLELGKTYIRPITRAIETPFRKLLGRKPKTHPDRRRYVRNLPSVLQQVDEAAEAGALGKALRYP
jgi:lipopolysaccharide biosynthesis glycosyltransferase